MSGFDFVFAFVLRDCREQGTEGYITSKFENKQVPASVYMQDKASSFLISSLSNLDHLEGMWATRPQILVSVSCLLYRRQSSSKAHCNFSFMLQRAL